MSIQQGAPQEVVSELLPSLRRSPDDPRPVVVMTCGINPSMKCLSIDEIVASRRGIWNIDYDPDKYSEY
ncbi:hypothetical protein AC579_2728 [Pseudocercospora musae]|uniref:Uncharacterized protein n=1 Tax=Pseudocercospora musae TaxID=113226 RepID=A0A139IVC5_9PEZI|nr:hypothetical protein AC579_2728 [Pseudocercospora musae]